MDNKRICGTVEKLLRKYGERDPFRLCGDMGVLLRFEPLGKDKDAIKGFFAEFCRVPSITVNSDLPPVIQKIIAAHELGHAVLHRGFGAFREIGLFDMSAAMETEANLFAAELLLDDDEVLDCLRSGCTFFTASARLCVPAELLELKFRLMKNKGYDLGSPISARSDFLKYMELPENTDEI